MNDDIRHLAANTHAVYERAAAVFDAQRSKSLFERPWLDRFTDLIPDGGAILDLGCGAGDPIARHLYDQGYQVTGADFSKSMLTIAKTKLPDVTWLHADMRTLNLGTTFDGIIAWNSFFHLTMDEQRITLGHMARHLSPNGAMMVTVGPSEGEVSGQAAGGPVYHSSLSPQEYRDRLGELGLEIIDFVPEDSNCNGHSVLLAARS